MMSAAIYIDQKVIYPPPSPAYTPEQELLPAGYTRLSCLQVFSRLSVQRDIFTFFQPQGKATHLVTEMRIRLPSRICLAA